MHLIDNPWAVATKPPAAPVGTPGYFQPGNPTIDLLATIVDYDWANTIQSELANVVAHAGLTLNKNDDTQLLASVIAIVNQQVSTGGNQYLPLTGGRLTGPVNMTGAAGTNRVITGETTVSGTPTTRWQLVLADSSAELGSNAGSNLRLLRYADNGTIIDAPITISRTTGVVDFAKTFTVAGVPVQGLGRPVLGAPVTLYVNFTNGDDSSAGTDKTFPMRTMQAAYDRIKQVDTGGYNCTIELDGPAYNQRLVCSGPLQGGGVVIIQSVTGGSIIGGPGPAGLTRWDTGMTVDDVVGAGGPPILVQNGATVALQYLWLTGGTNATNPPVAPYGGYCVALDGGSMLFENVCFDVSAKGGILAINNSRVVYHDTDLTTNPDHMVLLVSPSTSSVSTYPASAYVQQAWITLNTNSTATLGQFRLSCMGVDGGATPNAAPHFSVGLFSVSGNSTLSALGSYVPGGGPADVAIGPKYLVAGNSLIDVSPTGLIPANGPGVANTGGTYIGT